MRALDKIGLKILRRLFGLSGAYPSMQTDLQVDFVMALAKSSCLIGLNIGSCTSGSTKGSEPLNSSIFSDSLLLSSFLNYATKTCGFGKVHEVGILLKTLKRDFKLLCLSINILNYSSSYSFLLKSR